MFLRLRCTSWKPAKCTEPAKPQCLIPGSASRPADVFLPIWNRGRPAALDVTVISTLQDLTVAGAAATQGHALRIGEERKLAAHQSDCQATGISFVPLVVESLGGWCEEAVHTIGRIGRLLEI